MNKNSEMALQIVKKILDRAVQRGNIFISTDEVVDSINSYNYLVKICTDIELQPTQEQLNHKQDAVPDKV